MKITNETKGNENNEKGTNETKTAKGGHAKKAEGAGYFPILRCWRRSGTDDACGTFENKQIFAFFAHLIVTLT